MTRKRKTAEEKELEETRSAPVERILELIDEAVRRRGEAVLIDADETKRITWLAAEARRRDVSLHEIAKHVQRMDRYEHKLKPVTRQAVDEMIAVYEGRRPRRTTVASRRERAETVRLASSGRPINLEALE